MDSFIDSKNNLEIFAQDVEAISKLIQSGVKEYTDAKNATAEVFDGK